MRQSATILIPRTDDEIARVAQAIDLPIPAICLPGVSANLALLARHAAILQGRHPA